MPVNQPDYDTAVETNWDGVDQSEFEDFEQFASVHVWWNNETPETNEDVELPVAHMEDGELKLVYEALNSAHDLASQAIDNEDDVEEVRNILENLRENEFPDREPLDADSEENSKEKQEYEVGDTTIDISPPDQMINAAEAAQTAQEEGLIPGECGTGVGDRRADQITNDEIGPNVIDEIASYLTSHEEDVTAEGSPTDWNEEEWSDCGNAQYAKWGGVNDGEMKRWAQEKANEVAEARDEELPYPERESKQAEYQFEIGDWVRWEFGDGTSQGQITDRENEPGESLSAQGNEREATEEEPVYKMDEWDEEEMELTNDVVKSESELSEISQPEESRKIDTMSSKQELKQSIETQEQKTADKHLQIEGKDVELVKQDSESEPVINIPIQALAEDRDGDIINEKGQESIIRQLKSGTVPLVPNHGVGQSEAHYGFEDIFGQFIDGENRNGTTVATARLLEGNRFADKLIELLENDMPVGFSVGFRVLEGDERKEEGGFEIEKVDLMEVSAVGIPSNPEAVPQAMGSAVAMAKNAGLSKTEIVSTIEKAFNDTMSEKQSEDGTDQNNGSKSEEKNMKQMTSEDVEMAMEVVSSKVSEHMGMAMDEAEDEIMGMLDEEEGDEEDMEEEGEYTDEDEEDEEEMNQSDASDHTEDSEKDGSSESADEKSEETDEDLEMPENGKQGGKINEASESEEKSEDKTEDPFKVRSL